LHHSTGEDLWDGGVAEFFRTYNCAHGTNLQITERWYPGEPMGNYAYNSWNLWVNPASPANATQPGLHNLETLAANSDVIVFKHCFSSSCLKTRMRQFPKTKFILWTGAVLKEASTNPGNAQRAREFTEWVRGSWDEKGDNIYLWDFYALETEGTLYLKDDYAYKKNDSHPASGFARTVAPLLGQRIVDVVEGRGDSGSLTGK